MSNEVKLAYPQNINFTDAEVDFFTQQKLSNSEKIIELQIYIQKVAQIRQQNQQQWLAGKKAYDERFLRVLKEHARLVREEAEKEEKKLRAGGVFWGGLGAALFFGTVAAMLVTIGLSVFTGGLTFLFIPILAGLMIGAVNLMTNDWTANRIAKTKKRARFIESAESLEDIDRKEFEPLPSRWQKALTWFKILAPAFVAGLAFFSLFFIPLPIPQLWDYLAAAICGGGTWVVDVYCGYKQDNIEDYAAGLNESKKAARTYQKPTFVEMLGIKNWAPAERDILLKQIQADGDIILNENEANLKDKIADLLKLDEAQKKKCIEYRFNGRPILANISAIDGINLTVPQFHGINHLKPLLASYRNDNAQKDKYKSVSGEKFWAGVLSAVSGTMAGLALFAIMGFPGGAGLIALVVIVGALVSYFSYKSTAGTIDENAKRQNNKISSRLDGTREKEEDPKSSFWYKYFGKYVGCTPPCERRSFLMRVKDSLFSVNTIGFVISALALAANPFTAPFALGIMAIFAAVVFVIYVTSQYNITSKGQERARVAEEIEMEQIQHIREPDHKADLSSQLNQAAQLSDKETEAPKEDQKLLSDDQKQSDHASASQSPPLERGVVHRLKPAVSEEKKDDKAPEPERKHEGLKNA